MIDAHHHFWDPTLADYPWMTGPLEPLRRAFGPEDLGPHLAATGVERTVLVQTRSSLDETRDFLALAAKTPFVAGVVGWVDLTDPGVADVLDELRAGPGGDRLVGIRHQVHDEPDAGYLSRLDVARGLAAVADAGLVYDLLVRPRDLAAATDAARALQHLTFVVDHLAKPRIASGQDPEWAAALSALVTLPNVRVKLSGLVTEADWHHWTTDDLRPFVDLALEWAGPDRVMWGSDWPVCTLAASYAQVFDALVTILGGPDPAVFGGTAAATYGLGD